MENNSNKKDKIISKLLSKYRLVVLDEKTFEEQFFISLSRFNVIVISVLIISFFLVATFFLISYSPIKEYIPGYPSSQLRINSAKNALKLDSISQIMLKNMSQMNSLKKIFNDDFKNDDFDGIKSNQNINKINTKVEISKGKDDSLLREIVIKEDKYNFKITEKNSADYVLFPPAKGEISEGYNFEQKHFGIDIMLSENHPVKAIYNGIVIFSEWSAETGYVIIIEHPDGITSVYKHNSSLNKGQGDIVKTGEVIATAGNTGEYSTGWHLHFELWINGYSMDPTNFIDFKLN